MPTLDSHNGSIIQNVNEVWKGFLGCVVILHINTLLLFFMDEILMLMYVVVI